MDTQKKMQADRAALKQWSQTKEVKQEVEEAAQGLMYDLSLAGEETFLRIANAMNYMAAYGRASGG